jgi:HSP20 family protein
MMIRTRKPYFRLVDDLLNDARPWLTSGGESEARGSGPALDVEENADAYTVRANLPGVNLDDISVNIHEDVLTVSAETAAENRDENSKMLIRERRFGKFSRSLRFPAIVDGDAVEASYENGVLSITLPKAEHVKPRQIPVNVIADDN